MTTTVLWLGGTGHGSGGDGVSDEFARHLDPDRFRFRFVPYPADFGLGEHTHVESRNVGHRALLEAVLATSGPVIIGGYSQGAGIAGLLAADIGASETPWAPHVRGCALISDPSRPRGGGLGAGWAEPGYGILGQRPIRGVPTWWAAAPGDPITALPAGNPLRTVADISGWWSMSQPDDMVRWGESLLRRCRRGAWQRWWSARNWRSWGGAIAYARGFAVDGRHTDAYVREGHAARLAATVCENTHPPLDPQEVTT